MPFAPRGVPLLTALLLALASGCATRRDGGPAVLAHWLQLGGDGALGVRAIVAGAAECPVASVDGKARALRPRAAAGPVDGRAEPAPTRPAAALRFPVTSCELDLPPTARAVSLQGQPLPLPTTDVRRIVVIGDTGCRIKVPKSGRGDPIQDCDDPRSWPWPRVAAAAARTQPDLVIHVGDYHYREYCDNPALCSALTDKRTVVDYGWAGWNADFFAPAAPLLGAAPWIFVRGNHENCDRGGEGWMRFLSPDPYRACPERPFQSGQRSVLTNNHTADAYRIDVDDRLTLVVADNAGHEDYRPASSALHEVELFQSALRALPQVPAQRSVWLLAHRPIWYDLLAAAAPSNTLQSALHGYLPENVQFVFAGHEHAFQTLHFARDADSSHHPGGRPAQIIVGASGTQLEAFDPQSPFYEGETGLGSQERTQLDGRFYEGVAAAGGIVVHRYSFLLLERDGQAWRAALLDPDGATITHCRMNGARKQIDCRFPESAVKR